MACNIVRIDHLIIDEETREPPPVPSLKVTAKWVSVTIIVVKKVKETMINQCRTLLNCASNNNSVHYHCHCTQFFSVIIVSIERKSFIMLLVCQSRDQVCCSKLLNMSVL